MSISTGGLECGSRERSAVIRSVSLNFYEVDFKDKILQIRMYNNKTNLSHIIRICIIRKQKYILFFILFYRILIL